MPTDHLCLLLDVIHTSLPDFLKPLFEMFLCLNTDEFPLNTESD